MKLVIFAASDHSLLSLGLLEMALKNGCGITGVVIRSTLSVNRFKEELSKGGMHFVLNF